jgi:hypothetical protein
MTETEIDAFHQRVLYSKLAFISALAFSIFSKSSKSLHSKIQVHLHTFYANLSVADLSYNCYINRVFPRCSDSVDGNSVAAAICPFREFFIYIRIRRQWPEKEPLDWAKIRWRRAIQLPGSPRTRLHYKAAAD